MTGTRRTILPAGAQKVEFAYDYLGRRVRKLVWTWQNGWNLTANRKFVWSGWRMLLEIDEVYNLDQVVRKYTWGLDLAGQNGNVNSLEAAGTIGGLLAIEEPPQVRDVLNYLYLYDGNGNVGQMVEWQPDLTDPPGTWASQRLVAHYEYDPYGNITAQSGSYADANPIRFSTKYLDAETGLSYFGYRYYAPGLGRWINRDPIEELGDGGLVPERASRTEKENLYRYVGNGPTTSVDPLGLAQWKWPLCCLTEYTACITAPCKTCRNYCSHCLSTCLAGGSNPCHACGYCGASWWLCHIFGGSCGDWDLLKGILYYNWCIGSPRIK